MNKEEFADELVFVFPDELEDDLDNNVQTADEQILPEGTAYITDLGMTGPKNSVIGMDVNVSFKRFETTLPEKYKLADGECILNAVEFEVNDYTNKVTGIKRIRI